MSSHDDLSQLMPSLYSRVKLTHSADETAELMQYASLPRVPNNLNLNSPALSSKLQCQQLNVTMAPEPQLPLAQHRLFEAKGSGRIVARRGFNLQLRCTFWFVCFACLLAILALTRHVSADLG